MKRELSKTESIYYQEESMYLLFEKIQRKEFQLLKILKDSTRSYVALIQLEGKKYVYKEPREKNTRKWQRFLSFFRGSESKREGLRMQEIEKYFLCPKFCYAYEKQFLGMIIDSYLVYEYIEAEELSQNEGNFALEYLHKIHQKGFLHGDSQISNFLREGEKIYLIDSKFQKNRYGAFGKAYEIYYLELSCPELLLEVDRENLPYKIAKFWKDIKEFWVKQKTKRRERR